MSSIPKEKIVESVRKRGIAEVATISADLIESGYQHPKQEQKEGEHVNPFIADLAKTLQTMCEENVLQSDLVGGKRIYELKEEDVLV